MNIQWANSYNAILEIIHHWDDKGIQEFPDGTKQIAHVPAVAPRAWLHAIYRPLQPDEINQLEQMAGARFPLEYRDFLQRTNGLKVFSDSLSIWGLRTSYERSGATVQPYNLPDMNSERPKGCPPAWVYFGGYSWDGSRVIFDTQEGIHSSKVYCVKVKSTTIVKEWPSFYVYLFEELSRLRHFFNEDGYKKDRSQQTSPVYE